MLPKKAPDEADLDALRDKFSKRLDDQAARQGAALASHAADTKAEFAGIMGMLQEIRAGQVQGRGVDQVPKRECEHFRDARNDQGSGSNDEYRSMASGAPRGPSRMFDVTKLSPLPNPTRFRYFWLWVDDGDSNATCQRLENHSRAEQVGALLQAIGPDAKGIVRDAIGLDPKDPQVTVWVVLDELQKYFRANQSVTVDRRNFERAVQREGETFDSFVTWLKGCRGWKSPD